MSARCQTSKSTPPQDKLSHIATLEGNSALPPNKRHPICYAIPWPQKHKEHFEIRSDQEALFQEENEGFICKMASNVDEAKALIEAGFDYVCELNGVKLFRRRK